MSHDLGGVVAVTLDLDDTLWPIAGVIRAAEAAVLRWFDQHFPAVTARYSGDEMGAVRDRVAKANPHLAHDFMELRRRSFRVMLDASGCPPDQADQALDVFMEARHQVTLFDDARPALARLQQRFPLLAVTNGNAEIERCGLGDYFVGCIHGRRVGALKPDAIVFEAARHALGVPAGSIAHIGDDPVADVQGAHASGFRPLWLNRHRRDWPAGVAGDFVPPTFETLTECADALAA